MKSCAVTQGIRLSSFKILNSYLDFWAFVSIIFKICCIEIHRFFSKLCEFVIACRSISENFIGVGKLHFVSPRLTVTWLLIAKQFVLSPRWGLRCLVLHGWQSLCFAEEEDEDEVGMPGSQQYIFGESVGWWWNKRPRTVINHWQMRCKRSGTWTANLAGWGRKD